MDMNNSKKQETVDEINRLIAAWPAQWCRYLLKEAERMNPAATAPPPMKDENGHLFYGRHTVHVRSKKKDRSLCAQDSTTKLHLVSIEDFGMLHSGPEIIKCSKCERSLKKLKDKKITAEGYDWLRESLKDLIIAIFQIVGDKTGVWYPVNLEKLLPTTNYKSLATLRRGLSILKRRRIIEIKRGYAGRCSIKLICDCVKQTKSGDYFVSFSGPL